MGAGTSPGMRGCWVFGVGAGAGSSRGRRGCWVFAGLAWVLGRRRVGAGAGSSSGRRGCCVLFIGRSIYSKKVAG